MQSHATRQYSEPTFYREESFPPNADMSGTSFLNLQAAPPRSTEIWGRAIFWVRDVDEMHQRDDAAGYRSATEPADAAWGERYFHIHDPDGHEISFARPLD